MPPISPCAPPEAAQIPKTIELFEKVERVIEKLTKLSKFEAASPTTFQLSDEVLAVPVTQPYSASIREVQVLAE